MEAASSRPSGFRLRSERRRRRRRHRLRARLLLSLAGLAAASLITGPALVAAEATELPSVERLSTSYLDQDTLVYDRHGALLADIGRSGDHRIVVPLSAISIYAIQATIAIEDRSFYSNVGVDPGSTLRAALADMRHRGMRQGGSTITQQLAKVALLGPHPGSTVRRKLREMILALQINQRYSKAQVLELYLNTIYYGDQSYGIEAAARAYFRTSAQDLTLAQASLLAGLPQAPSRYNPLVDPTLARLRQAQVLAAMVLQHSITQGAADQARADRLRIFPLRTSYEVPQFVRYVLGLVKDELHLAPAGWTGLRIYTSLDLPLQRRAEAAIHDQITQVGNYYNFHDAALVSMDPHTGEILAMVGSNDPRSAGGQINMALQPRPPGSSFKIFTYTAAIESRRLNMVSPILDAPLTFPVFGGPNGFAPYSPTNYDGRFHGVVPLKMAMGNSLNVPAIKTELWVGIPAVLSAARRMGVESLPGPDTAYSMSLTLGSYGVTVLDMATGASTLAALGTRHRPAPILRVRDGLGRSLFSYDPSANAVRAVTPQVAFIIASIMSDDRNRCLQFGCHGDLTLPGHHVAAKTGTTQLFRDNWTVGFTPDLATAVWIGNPDNQPLSRDSTGIVGAAPIWHRFMTEALHGMPDQWYTPPTGLDAANGDYFLPGTEQLPPLLAQPWPRCRFMRYNPYSLTYGDLLVDGVPCAVG
jgi:membrane peptidoglycan carboxypeptidase